MNDDLENKDPKNEDNSSDEEIPLWLQGLVSNDQEKQDSNDLEEDNEDSWLPELSDEPDYSEDDQGRKEDNDPPPSLETMNTTNPKHADHENELNQSENKEEIDIDKLPNGSHSNDIGPTIDDLPSSEGFIEISDIETTEFSLKDEPTLEDEPLIEGELPEWLQEMIAEQEQPQVTGINDGVVEKHGLDEERKSDQEPKLQEPPFDEEDAQDDDFLVFNDELDEEEPFTVDIDGSNKSDMDMDSGWFSEQDEPIEEEKVTSEKHEISEEISNGVDDIAAYEMAEDETQPINVSSDDKETSSLIQDEPFIEDTPFLDDDLDLSDSLDEAFAEDSTADEQEYFSPWVEDSSKKEHINQEEEETFYKVEEEPLIDDTHLTNDEERPSATKDDPFGEKTFEKENEDDQKEDQVEPSFIEHFATEDKKDTTKGLEEPFVEDPQSDDEDFSSPPFGVPYESETFSAEDKDDRLSGSIIDSSEEDLSSTFEQEHYSIDEEEQELPDIDEAPLEKHHEVKEEEDTPSLEKPHFVEPQIDEKEEIFDSLEESLIEENLASEKEEEPVTSREEISINETYLDEEDDVLEDLKRQIEQGNFKIVTATISDQIDDPNHLEKLELWIREATESTLERKSELWETLGDINSKQNRPDEAFNAYMKAVKHLLSR